jgi:uncharacterized protein (DUF4415 family)
MKKVKEYDFSKARRITPAEVEANRKAIEAHTGKPRRKRPGPAPTPAADRHQPVSIRLHPAVMKWARKEADKRGVGYQTVINETLLKKAVA